MISQHYFTFPFHIPRLCWLVRNWPQYLINYLSRRRRPAVYSLRNGGRLIDATGTLAGTFAVVFLRKEYGTPAGARTIVDVGANLGCFSVFAATECPEAIVYSYEPGASNFAVLGRNIAANNLQNRVRAYQMAIGGQEGKRELAVGESPMNSIVMKVDSSHSEIVRCTTLGEIMSSNGLSQIDFLKLNCEGAEYEIIERCPDSDLRKVGTIRMEYHAVDDARQTGKALAALLEAKGFKINRFTNYRNVSGFIWADRIAHL